MLFSPSQKAFFNTDVTGDCIEITNEKHNEIMNVVYAGGYIDVDEDNNPMSGHPDIESVGEPFTVTLMNNLESIGDEINERQEP